MSPFRSCECTVKKPAETEYAELCDLDTVSNQERITIREWVNSLYRPYEAIFRSIAASEFSGGFQVFSSSAIIATQGAWYIISERTERHVLKKLGRDYVLRMNSVTFSPGPIKYIILLFVCDLKATKNIYSFYKSYKISSNSSESSL